MNRLSVPGLRKKKFQPAVRTRFWLAGALLISLLALIAPFASVMSQGGGFSVEYDVDRGGSDYKNYEVSGGHEVCRDACANDANCKAYTYTRPWQGYSAKCWLKDSVPEPVPGRSCCISGVKNGASGNGGVGGGNAPEVTWNSYPADQQFGLYGKIGPRVTVRCPPLPAGTSPERVIGTDVYTDDSRFCVAAVHSGLITFGAGGVVTIEMLAPLRYYTGSERYGVRTLNYNNESGGYKTSFRYVR